MTKVASFRPSTIQHALTKSSVSTGLVATVYLLAKTARKLNTSEVRLSNYLAKIVKKAWLHLSHKKTPIKKILNSAALKTATGKSDDRPSDL